MPTNSLSFLTIVNGIKTLASGITASAGVGDANKVVATGANGKLDYSLMPSGIGAATEVIISSEILSAGDFVNIYDNAGTRTVRKADASNVARYACGFVLSAVTSGGNATITLQGTNTAITGLTPGTRYFLSSTTPGGYTVTSPTAANTISQLLGFAAASNSLNFEFEDFVLNS